MSNTEMIEKLNQAQKLLSDVYHFAFETNDVQLENLMSAADSCIIEAIDKIGD